MVASSEVVPVVLPVTRLPGDTRRSPMRPATGARSSVNSRSSVACSTAASRARDRRLGDALGLGALVEGLLGDGALLHELGAAGEVGLGKGEVGLRLLEIALA